MSSCKLCPGAAREAAAGSSSCGCSPCASHCWLLLRNQLHIEHAAADDLPSPLPLFQDGQHCWSVFFFFFFCLNWHSMFYLLQEAEIICITFGLPTSNYIHPFVLLACWSWKCNLLLFCLRCCINYWILPCFISSEPGSCCGCSKQVFCTFICFTFNTEVVFSADCEKWQGHLGFFGCWVRDCFDPGNEFKWKYSIYKRITCRSTSTGAQFGVMVKPQKQPSGEVCRLQSSTWN